MDDTAWWQRWFARHPLKTPDTDRAAFTADVMRQVRQHAPVARPASASWMPRWLPVPAVALAAAAVFLVLGRPHPTPLSARTILEASQQLAALDDSYAVLTEDAQGQVVLSNGWDELDRMMFAEAAAEDTTWLEELSQTLDELDAENVSGAPEGGAEEEWWKELETLESETGAASS